ncbi:hypothetical protein ACFFK0_04080 [Paenibacillus chartarius]|uniref:Uncharacterized protein n=1 Tax=Paenibacillus chartarius TaxID=747481 RepID=A0ABV6DGB1_9BACL
MNEGEQMVLEQNSFIKFNLPDEEPARYRRPFLEPGESCRPICLVGSGYDERN